MLKAVTRAVVCIVFQIGGSSSFSHGDFDTTQNGSTIDRMMKKVLQNFTTKEEIWDLESKLS